MITRPYLLSTTSSNSSMGGLIIPSSAGVPATVCLPLSARARADLSACAALGSQPSIGRPIRRLGRHQGYQLSADISDRRVDQRDVEFTLRAQFRSRRFQPLPDHLSGLGLPAGEPADEFLP